MRARCSSARRRSASNTPTSTARSPIWTTSFLLFAAVNVARRLGADPELELRRASQRFVSRVQEAERLAGNEGQSFADLALDEQDRYYDLAKERE